MTVQATPCRHRLRITALAAACSFLGLAQAQEACNSFDGQTMHPVKANRLWKKLATIPNVKGEYETTAAYEARVANALGELAGPVTLEIPLDAKYMVYDADAIVKPSGSDAWDAAALRGIQRTEKLPRDVDRKVPAKLTVNL